MAGQRKFVRERAVDLKNILPHPRVRKPVYTDLRCDETEERGLKKKKLKHNKENEHPLRSSLVSKEKCRHGKSQKKPSSKTSKPKEREEISNLDMHKLLFKNANFEGTDIAYYAQGKERLQGKIQGNGILCNHCDKEVSPSEFEKHAHCHSYRKPYHHIITKDGLSLHDLSEKASRSWREKRGDECSECKKIATEGVLICCDNCHRVFHLGCVDLSSFPAEDWNCKFCPSIEKKQKFTKSSTNGTAAGSICALCRGQNLSDSESDFEILLILCDQCEREFHVKCLKEHKIDDLKELPAGKWFCCKDCSEIHSKLTELVKSGDQLLPEFVQEKWEKKCTAGAKDISITWRLLSGRKDNNTDEENEILLKADKILHERFDPMIDPSSGIDLIYVMVNGGKLARDDLQGMHCAVLMVNTNIVSVGTMRIFGKELAELPLVATSIKSRGQGYFQELFGCLEDKLATYGVKKLVLPAAPEKVELWINKYGFKEISKKELRNSKKHYPLMEFQETRMLQKSIVKKPPPRLGLEKF